MTLLKKIQIEKNHI